MNGSQAWLEKDFYKALGVDETADEAAIRRAYRKLAQKHHPDRNPGDKRAEERMKEISEAYDVLSDAQKRQEYDNMRRFAAQGGPFGGGNFGGGFGGPGGFNIRVEDLGDLGDVFSQMFGGGRRGRARPARGEDRQTEARLSFEDAMRGATIAVNVAQDAVCETCGGSGAKPGTPVSTCPTCNGQGTIEDNQGLFSIPRVCPTCAGTGRKIETPCPTCRGAGRVTRPEQVRVRVPAGVKDGARIRVRGRGAAGAGAPGDLYVTVHVAPHRLFGRQGDDLTLSVPITFSEAALGAKVKVPTLDASVTVKVPAGTQNGRTFRVRGKGAPRAKGGGYGDLLVTVNVVVPEKLSHEQKDLLEKLAAADGADVRSRLEVS
jgi:molecular chaperone DnaJ